LAASVADVLDDFAERAGESVASPRERVKILVECDFAPYCLYAGVDERNMR